MLTTFLIIVLVVLVWALLVVFLDKRGLLEKRNMSRIWFLALMWRTERGRGLIDKIASPKKFWKAVSWIGIAMFFLGMLAMFFMLAFSAYFSIISPLVEPVGAEEVLVLPGINPYVPFIYGIIGLVVAVVAHEFSHGIMARAEGFKVKSLGLLFILIPIGAFMEPDEEEVEKGPRRSRRRMFVAGPMINFFMAILFIGLFSWGFVGSLEAEDDPLIITDISKGSPLHHSLDNSPKALYSVNGTQVHSSSDLAEIEGFDPGDWAILEIRIDNERILVPSICGVVVMGVGDETPAEKAEIEIGSIIVSIDNIAVNNSEKFHEIMDSTVDEQIVNFTFLVPSTNGGNIVESTEAPDMSIDSNLTYVDKGSFPSYVKRNVKIELANKYDYYPIDSSKGKGYLGVTSSYFGIFGVGSEEFKEALAHPLSSGEGFKGKFANIMYITFRLPLDLEIMPFHDPLTDIYEVKGPLSILPEPVFWFMTNTIFYIFWINILLGLFNALPMIPLDGGFVFRDTIVLIMKRFKKEGNEERMEKIAKKISVYASFTILALLLVIIFYPWIRTFFP